ncbi:3-deoxy-manno-octulosonate cytidylyltransferase [Aminipila luticellarii]|uniref:3-deoxy-manno-octulosonate cytidylyltransferase n=1 Tax=Aminipila luticellarii TaxID=2507160 RepID=A0A410PSF5_9FIRM|nr:3-deoxy-manno-octulosonate cytidylyltransferase [Aminipila luticellarii]QAT41921.1 3-deoxy-manno-octulosonate cytidylyltransferase [Aminipila luticellarii]
MKIIGVIPARYSSTRFPGKPLADICGRPMIWWVYHQVKKTQNIDEVYVATDDERIAKVCSDYNLNYVMTLSKHKTSTERLYEVAQKIPANLYICINGDEPLITPNTIEQIIPSDVPDGSFYVSNLMTEIKYPAEVIDFTNIKVVTDEENSALFMSRSPIPYPKSSLDYVYYKHIGVLIYTLEALRFFSETPKGKNELIEDINELRFIEHGKRIKMIEVDADTLSVDTPKDLEVVRDIITKTMKLEEIVNE